MPRMDGTGPMGNGPMTGRGMGPCGRGQGQGQGMRQEKGQGMGMGQGQLQGMRKGSYDYNNGSKSQKAPNSPKEKIQILEEQEKELLEELDIIRAERESLEK